MPRDLRSLRKRLGKCRGTQRGLRKRFGKCRGTQRGLRKRFSNSYRQNTTRTNPTLGARPCLIICTGEGGMSLPIAPVLLILFPQEDL